MEGGSVVLFLRFVDLADLWTVGNLFRQSRNRGYSVTPHSAQTKSGRFKVTHNEALDGVIRAAGLRECWSSPCGTLGTYMKRSHKGWTAPGVGLLRELVQPEVEWRNVRLEALVTRNTQ